MELLLKGHFVAQGVVMTSLQLVSYLVQQTEWRTSVLVTWSNKTSPSQMTCTPPDQNYNKILRIFFLLYYFNILGVLHGVFKHL